MADNNDSLLREVEEEIRRERMQKLWERYNGLILGGAFLVVLAVGGYKYLEYRRVTLAQTAGSEFAAAQQLGVDKKNEEAAKAFQQIAKSGPPGYAALAKLHLAGSAIKAGKADEAIAAYESLIDEPGVDRLLKNFAQLQIAALQIGTADFTDVKNRLTPLASDDSAYKTTAQELLGVAAFKAGKLDEARKYLEPLLLDPSASRGLQERLKVVMGEIARSETGTAETPKASVTPPAGSDAKSTEPAEKPAASQPETK
jgi:hypothetical protein